MVYLFLMLFCIYSFTECSWGNTLLNLYNQTDRSRRCYAPSYKQYELTERQARNYIEQCVAALDYALRPHIQDRQLMQLKNRILTSVLNSAYVWTSSGKLYKKDTIDQYINSAVLEYIEETSYDYAYKKTYDSSIARKVAESMRNNALARIQRYGALDAESLIPFVGDALKRAVDDYINQWHYNQLYQGPTYHSLPSFNYETPSYTYQPAQSPEYEEEEKFYPSDACCVCLETFDVDNNNSVSRVFLQPCGHDMCKACAYQWFFVPNRNAAKTCPQCRGKVNLDKLSLDIASAPAV